jgi:hypothetical protein
MKRKSGPATIQWTWPLFREVNFLHFKKQDAFIELPNYGEVVL